MINRVSDRQTIDSKSRYLEILEVLKVSKVPLSARDVARRYIHPVCSSDVLSTGSILNMMSYSGVVEKIELPRNGKAVRFLFKLRSI